MTSVHGGIPRKECKSNKMSEIYHGLLELWHGDKRQKTLSAKEWVSREGLSILEMEQCMNSKMFLNEYPHWEVEGLHHPLILQGMFLQAAHSGRKEVECMIC